VEDISSNSLELPEDSASLRAMVQQLQVELVRVKLELERYKKWYYGPRADRRSLRRRSPRRRSSGCMRFMLSSTKRKIVRQKSV
jgi:hypothetical protein